MTDVGPNIPGPGDCYRPEPSSLVRVQVVASGRDGTTMSSSRLYTLFSRHPGYRMSL